MEQIIGACGLVCSDCGAYKYTQAGNAAAVARLAEQWNKEYGTGVRPEHVWCDGCLASGERKCGHCAECEIRACVVSHDVPSCAHCADYGCEKIDAFLEMAPGARETLDAIRAEQ